MTIYVRKQPCAICGKNVYWDSERKTLTCGCGTFPAPFINFKDFKQLPKVDAEIWKENLILPIDAWKFIAGKTYYISDRFSLVKKGEDPRLVARWSYYQKFDKIQLSFGCRGNFHTEPISYNQKDPKEWKERLWIYISSDMVKKLIKFLERDPNQLASWM